MTQKSGQKTKDVPETRKGKRGELFKIAEIAVEHSNGHLRLAHNEEDTSEQVCDDAAHFLKLDGNRIGRDIELYGFMGEVAGWEEALVRFFEEILLGIKRELPESYAKAGEALRTLGESVYAPEMREEWRKLF